MAGNRKSDEAVNDPSTSELETESTVPKLIDWTAMEVDSESQPIVDEETQLLIMLGLPNKETYFMAHPTMRRTVRILEVKKGDKDKSIGVDTYVIIPKSPAERAAAEFLKTVEYTPIITDEGVIRLVGVPGVDPLTHNWHPAHESRDLLIKAAMKGPVRRRWSKSNSSYIVVKPVDSLDNFPTFPEKITLDYIFDAVFKAKIISEADHPVIKKLLGKK
jgi:hypothetical protein